MVAVGSMTQIKNEDVMSINSMNRTIIYLLILAFFALTGCKSNSHVNKLSESEKQERQKAWDAASPVMTAQQIIGGWNATAKDMPDGDQKISWSWDFTKEGEVLDTVVLPECPSGSVEYFTVKNSRLYISESKNEEPDETGEIRLKSNILYLRTDEGIYQFKRY